MQNKVPYLIVTVDKIIFAKIYRNRVFDIDFQPDHTVTLKNEFVRIKTPFNEDWFADYKIFKILMQNNKWRIFLGERIVFSADGTKEKRWFQKDFEDKGKEYKNSINERKNETRRKNGTYFIRGINHKKNDNDE